MLMIANKSPTHMIGVAEGLSQKFAYYKTLVSVHATISNPEGHTSARNFLRYMRTDKTRWYVSEQARVN
jgi:hypothetical protein